MLYLCEYLGNDRFGVGLSKESVTFTATLRSWHMSLYKHDKI